MSIATECVTGNNLPLSVGAISEIGQRDENQDNMTGFASPLGAVYLIADGMGGYYGGAEASRIVTETFRTQLLAARPTETYWDTLARAAHQANQELMGKACRATLGSPVWARPR